MNQNLKRRTSAVWLSALALVALGVLYASSPWFAALANEAIATFTGRSDISAADRIDDPFHEYGMATWEEDAEGTATVRIQIPADWSYPSRRMVLEYTARLGPYKYEWEQEYGLIEPGDDVSVAIEVPSDAYLHEDADTYLTVLYVRVYVSGESGDLPAAYLAWPDGTGQPAVVWTKEQATLSAPYGVQDSSLQASAALALSDPTDFLLPAYEGSATQRSTDTGLAASTSISDQETSE